MHFKMIQADANKLKQSSKDGFLGMNEIERNLKF